MAADDITLDVGLRAKLDDAKVRDQLANISKKAIPIRLSAEKAIRGRHQRTVEGVVSLAEEVRRATGATPFQSVRQILKDRGRKGTIAREIFDQAEKRLQANVKREKDLEKESKRKEQEVVTAQKEQGKIDKDTIREQRWQERIAKTSEAIGKDVRGVFKLSKLEQEKVKETASILKKKHEIGQELKPQERKILEASDLLQEKQKPSQSSFAVLAAGFKKIFPVAAMGYLAKKALDEVRREAWIADARASVTGFNARGNIYLEGLGMERHEAIAAQAEAGMFRDQMRMGEVSSKRLWALGLWGRKYYQQLMTNPNDTVALQAAAEESFRNAEAQGFSRQYAAQLMGNEQYLKTTGYGADIKNIALKVADSAKSQEEMATFARNTRQSVIMLENEVGNIASDVKNKIVPAIEAVAGFFGYDGNKEEKSVPWYRNLFGSDEKKYDWSMEAFGKQLAKETTPQQLGLQTMTPILNNQDQQTMTPISQPLNITLMLDENSLQQAMNGGYTFSGLGNVEGLLNG